MLSQDRVALFERIKRVRRRDLVGESVIGGGLKFQKLKPSPVSVCLQTRM